MLVCMTATAGYGMAPGPLSLQTAVYATIGTALASSAANSINQILEVPFDSQMNRTKNRWDRLGFALEYISQIYEKLLCYLSKINLCEGDLIQLSSWWFERLEQIKVHYFRVLVRGCMSTFHAFSFALVTASVGTILLYTQVSEGNYWKRDQGGGGATGDISLKSLTSCASLAT